MECPNYNDLYDEYIRIKNGETEIYAQHIASCEKCKLQMMFIEEIYNVAEESYKEKYNGCLEPEKLISFADNKIDNKNRISFINKILTCKHCKKVFVDLKKLSKENYNNLISNIVQTVSFKR